jgi:hypothetical protein
MNSKSPEYGIWLTMRSRCNNPNANAYYRYGGRGIKVCERWEVSFSNFIEDMGPRPSNKHSIDRIDNNGDYEPGNCRWGILEEQARNRSNAVRVSFGGQNYRVDELSKISGLAEPAVRQRLAKGWSAESFFDGGAEAKRRRDESRARISAEKTHCRRGHEYTPENIYWRNDPPRRMCKTCNALSRTRRPHKFRAEAIDSAATTC